MGADSPACAVLRLTIFLIAAIVLWSAHAWRDSIAGFASPHRTAVRAPVPNAISASQVIKNARPTNTTRRLLRHPNTIAVGAAQLNDESSVSSPWQTMDTRSYNSPRIRAMMATWDRLNPGLIHHVHNDSSADEFMRTTFTDEVYDVCVARVHFPL